MESQFLNVGNIKKTRVITRVFLISNGSLNQSKIEHIEVFLPLVEYIREHFTDAYEFVEKAYKVVVERSDADEDEE